MDIGTRNFIKHGWLKNGSSVPGPAPSFCSNSFRVSRIIPGGTPFSASAAWSDIKLDRSVVEAPNADIAFSINRAYLEGKT